MRGIQDRIDRRGKGLPVGQLVGLADLINICLQDHGQHIPVADAVVGDFHALHGGQPVQDHLLQGLLHLRIAVVPQAHGKPHHRGLRDLDDAAQLTGRHKRRLVVGGQDILGNQFLPLGKF